MSPVLDALPAALLAALVLAALAVTMPVTSAREARRAAGWARFRARAGQAGLSPADLEALAAWARIDAPEEPWRALERGADFDRFARAEAARARELPAPARAARVEALDRLRRRLGFAGQPGLARSTHDLRPGDLLELRPDAGERLELRVAVVDADAIVCAPPSGAEARRRPLRGPAWASFGRDGEGTYRFRTRPAPGRALALEHGEFLLLEERRREHRARLDVPPFWVAVERLPDGAALEDPEGVEVAALDASEGGVALLADRDVRRGAELGLDLPLGGGEVLTGLRARVVGRGFREGGGRRAHFLHCAWVDLDPVQRRALARLCARPAAWL